MKDNIWDHLNENAVDDYNTSKGITLNPYSENGLLSIIYTVNTRSKSQMGTGARVGPVLHLEPDGFPVVFLLRKQE